VYHTAVILADGTVRTFGRNQVGQLGVNDTTNRLTPVQVFGISSSAVAIAGGWYNTAVLLSDGTVRTFGDNLFGQLGINVTGGTRQTPVQVLNITSASAVACGRFITAVLLTDGTVGTFGRNAQGNLGVNDTTSRPTPVQVWGISSSATAVACGYYHTAVLLADGTVRTFGDNSQGQLGINLSGGSRQTPVQVWGISSSAVAIAGGGFHTTVLLADGTVRTFGNNTNGGLGIDVSGGSRQTPVTVLNISTATAVGGGYYHTTVLLADGTVRKFGRNTQGQLGVNDTTSRQTPVQVFGISSTAVALSAGLAYHTALLLTDGSVRTFGNNTYGQLGVGDTASRLTPVQVVSGFSSMLGKVAAGQYHTATVMADGTVRAFGNNAQGQLGVNDNTNRLTAVQVWGISSSATSVACGQRFTAVLLADGTVRTFGSNGAGNLGVNDTTQRSTPVQVFGISSSATAVACGTYQTAVLLADGTVRTFGSNGSGQLGVNDTTDRSTPVQVFGISSSATAVACGGYHVIVLLGNGTVRTFGQNNVGQLGVNDTANRSTPVQVTGITSATAVAGGSFHTAVLLADGTVRAFGSNGSGQIGVNDSFSTAYLTPVQVFGISSSATAVACTRNHTIVLLGDGTVRTFGGNAAGQLGVNDTTARITPVTVLNITSATAIAGGRYLTAMVLMDGTARTVGLNTFGQLGVADTVNRRIPVKVGVSGNKVAGGFYYTAVVSNDGTVRTFGDNTYGGLGLGDTTQRNTPVQVTGLTSAIAAAVGYHTAVLLADGTVRTFGRNDTGNLGINASGATSSRLTPVQVWGISSSAVAVACGSRHTAVLLVDGTVRTFGNNPCGQLGVNDTTTRQTPVQVFAISSSATAIACGRYHTAVILADGTVRTFGLNDNGQLGVNDLTQRPTPVQVWGISSSATAVACGMFHTAVLLSDGTVRTFGWNDYGQLGLNDTTQRNTPVQVFGISSSAAAIACGSYHTAVLLADGTVRTFGNNGQGRLGVNDTTSRLTPVQVFGISSSATAIAGGFNHTALLLQDGTVRTFGQNGSGQLGVNDTTSRLTPVQVVTGFIYGGGVGKVAGGGFFTGVVTSDGTVKTFGYNGEGELGVNDTTNRSTPVQVFGISSSATAVAFGTSHTAVLLADGTVRTFGYNTNGQLGINESGGSLSRLTPVQVFGISSSATAVAGGGSHTIVLLANGTVMTFGRGGEGQLGVNDTASRLTPVQVLNITSATAVACGAYLHSVVLLSDGTVRTFGRNNNGQLGVNDITNRSTPVQVFGISSSATAVAGGRYHTAVLLSNGTVMTFGRGVNGQLGNDVTAQRNTPVQVFGISSSATAVACGWYHTAVLLSNGTVRTFGRNDTGQLGVNDTTQRNTPVQVFGISSSAVAIACGNLHTAVLLANGTVRTFGLNDYGALGVNDTTSRPTPVTVLNIANAGTVVSSISLTGATAIVVPLSSASTPVASFLLSTAAIITYPFVQFPALNLGPVTYPQYQLELTTDYARKLTTSTWTIGSDERLKTDIETANVDRCVEIVQNLDLKRFAWNFPDGSQPPDSHSLGWIAQEFAQFFPRSVDEAPAHGIMDFKNLNSDQIIKVMWGALKKLRADLKSQKSSDSELSTAGDNASPAPE